MLKTHGRIDDTLKQLLDEISELRSEASESLSKIFVPPANDLRRNMHREPYRPQPEDAPLTQTQDTESKSMATGERAMLIAVAHNGDGMTRQHITVHTGYKRSTRDAYILRLQSKNYVRAAMGKIVATQQGIAALGNDYEPMPTGSELIALLKDRLPEGEWKILELLLANPDGLDRDIVSDSTGFKRSTRDAYILRLPRESLS